MVNSPDRRGRVEQTKRKHWVRLGAFAFVLALISLLATWVGLSGTWVGDDWHMVNNYLYEDWAELGASENVFSDPTIWLSLPRLAANGTAALLAFRAEAMQSLSWMLFGRWSTFEWLGLGVVLLVPSFLSYRRDWPGPRTDRLRGVADPPGQQSVR